MNIISELIALPLGDLISSVGKGVGEAQAALDAGSLAQTKAIYTGVFEGEKTDEYLKQLKEINYQPTFYVIPETEVELQLSLSVSGTSTSTASTATPPATISNPSLRLAKKLYVTPVNASNANKYNINLNATTKIKFKIVPIPPPVAIEAIEND